MGTWRDYLIDRIQVKDNPTKIREEVLYHMRILIELNMGESNKGYLFYDHYIPTCCKRYFDSI